MFHLGSTTQSSPNMGSLSADVADFLLSARPLDPAGSSRSVSSQPVGEGRIVMFLGPLSVAEIAE